MRVNVESTDKEGFRIFLKRHADPNQTRLLTTAAHANIELANAREAVAPMDTIQAARERGTINARGRKRHRCCHNRRTAPAELHAAANNKPDGAERQIERHREPTARRHAPIRLNTAWGTRGRQRHNARRIA